MFGLNSCTTAIVTVTFWCLIFQKLYLHFNGGHTVEYKITTELVFHSTNYVFNCLTNCKAHSIMGHTYEDFDNVPFNQPLFN